MRCSRFKSTGLPRDPEASGAGGESKSGVALEESAIVLVRDTGLEFLSECPYDLFCEFDLDLTLSGQRVQGKAIVVGCKGVGRGCWRVAVLVEMPHKDRENLSLAA